MTKYAKPMSRFGLNWILAILVLVSVLSGCGGSQGAAGPQGPAGALGATGAQGTPGTGLTISSGLFCSKTDSGSGSSLYYQYESVIYSTGDRFVTCSITSTLGEYSNSFLYRSTQGGATNGGCVVAYDIDGTSSGFWYYTSQSGTTKTVYNDVGNASNGYTYTFVSGDCNSF